MSILKSTLNQSDFAMRLAGKFLSGGHRNVVVSPASIGSTVGLLAAGAWGNALNRTLAFLNLKKEEIMPTYSHIVGTTLADGSLHGGPCMSFVNGVWLDHSMKFQELFREVANGSFKAFIQEVDFLFKAEEVRMGANLWAEKESNGSIKDLLPRGSFDWLSRLIFANAFSFKGSWIDKFNVSDTKDDEFHTRDGNEVQVPFMRSNGEQYAGAFDGFKVLQLPYNQEKDKRHFSMYIYLPNAKDGLASLVQRMCSEHGFIDKYVPCDQVTLGEFKIPKFKLSYQLELTKDFKGMGLVLPFFPGGLREMVINPNHGRNLYVTSIYHKSLVEINEEGSKEGAATATNSIETASHAQRRVPCMDFVADHPFAFVITETISGVVLLAGNVVNPRANN